MTYREFCDTFLPLSERLLSNARGITASQNDAEDAVQDLFIKLWQQREVLDNVHNPEAYAVRVLKNLCIDRLRTAKPSENLPEELYGLEGGVSIEDKEAIRILTNAIERLPSTQKHIIEMRTIEEMSFADISKRLGMSQLTVRVLLSRARKTLRQYGNE